MITDFLTGTVEGTGSAINISLGFVPRYVKVLNIDDAGDLDPEIEWFSPMPDAAGIKKLSIADDGSSSALSREYITSNGISEYDGVAAGATEGFTIGADGDLNVNEETLVWMALR